MSTATCNLLRCGEVAIARSWVVPVKIKGKGVDVVFQKLCGV